MRAAQGMAPPLPRRGRRGRASLAAARLRVRPGARAVAPVQAAYPIGTLARIAGVSTRTVRYYEEIGLLRTARRFSGGRRVFDADALERLRFIARLKRLGFSLAEIRHLNEVFALHRSTAQMLAVLDGQLAKHLGAIDEHLRELTRLRTELAAYRQRVRARLHAQARQARRAP
jgi:DNA-binding transcriptional MerR regulator